MDVSGCTIEPANVRDGSYVVLHLRPEDREEVACQTPVPDAAEELAMGMVGIGGYVAYTRDHVPAMLFGASPMSGVALNAWSVGTARVREVIPTVTRFLLRDMSPKLREAGFRWVEARVYDQNASAKRWLGLLGAKELCKLPDYGVNGEQFALFTRHL